MSNLRNKVNLIGRVGNTPEKKEVGNGYTLTRFSIATNESLKILGIIVSYFISKYKQVF